MADAKWYVVHTYSGYENKVKANIEKTIENRHLEDLILEVLVPMEDVTEMKNGAKKQKNNSRGKNSRAGGQAESVFPLLFLLGETAASRNRPQKQA